MDESRPSRAQRMAQQLETDKGRLIAQGVLPVETAHKQVKAADKETPEQRAKRRAAVAKLRSFFD